MRIVSIQIGRPRKFQWKGKEVLTGIFKDSVMGPLWIRKHNLEGDEQADRKAHGGEKKAVYSYASEHYNYWRGLLHNDALSYGLFGENITTAELDEESICMGDRLWFGNALLQATEPRFPCSKLGIRFGDDSIIKKFTTSGKVGIYYSVLDEGELKVGDPIRIGFRHPERIRIYDVFSAKLNPGENQETLKKLASLDSLGTTWRKWAINMLNR